MTPATVKPTRGADRYRPERLGVIIFASAMLAIVGCFNLIYGAAAIASSHVFVANAHFMLGGLRACGWIMLIIGGLQFIVTLRIFAGNQLTRWLGVTVLGLNAINQMLFIGAYRSGPWRSLACTWWRCAGCALTAAVRIWTPHSSAVCWPG
jgi:hypothetical protein